MRWSRFVSFALPQVRLSWKLTLFNVSSTEVVRSTYKLGELPKSPNFGGL